MYYVGIDIAKSFHVVSIIDETETMVLKKPFRVENSLDGYFKFIDKLINVSSNVKDFTIGLEATGIYGENLWEFLNSKGYNVKLLNPFQTSRYREQITMKKVKNDNIDSTSGTSISSPIRAAKAISTSAAKRPPSDRSW